MLKIVISEPKEYFGVNETDVIKDLTFAVILSVLMSPYSLCSIFFFFWKIFKVSLSNQFHSSQQSVPFFLI